MIIQNSVREGYSLNKHYWFPQGTFALLYTLIVGLLILPFAFFVAITATILGDKEVTNFTWESVLFWFSVMLLVYASTAFMAMLMGTLQFRANEKEKDHTISFEEGLKHPFTDNRLKSYLIFSGYLFLLLVILGLISSGVSQLMGLNDNHDFGIVDVLLLMVDLIIIIIILSAANLSVMEIAEGNATTDAFFVGWKKFYHSIVDLFSINLVAAIPIAIVITATALIGILIDVVGPAENQDASAGELTLILILSFFIICIQLVMIFFAFPLYASIVSHGNEKVEVSKG